MHQLPVALSLALLTTAGKASTFDSSLCRSIWITLFDDGSPPAPTYVLSSDTYSLATTPCPTLGILPLPPPPAGGKKTKTHGHAHSYPNIWNPTPPPSGLPPVPIITQLSPSPPMLPSQPIPINSPPPQQGNPTPSAVPPVITTGSPLLPSLPINSPPMQPNPTTRYTTVPFPLRNRTRSTTTMQNGQGGVTTQVQFPPISSNEVSMPAVVPVFSSKPAPGISGFTSTGGPNVYLPESSTPEISKVPGAATTLLAQAMPSTLAEDMSLTLQIFTKPGGISLLPSSVAGMTAPGTVNIAQFSSITDFSPPPGTISEAIRLLQSTTSSVSSQAKVISPASPPNSSHSLSSPRITETGLSLTSAPVPMETSNSPTASPIPPIGGSCSVDNVCPPGECCSQYGFCGTTSDFCASGCQPEAGFCWSSLQSSSSPIVLPGLSTSPVPLVDTVIPSPSSPASQPSLPNNIPSSFIGPSSIIQTPAVYPVPSTIMASVGPSPTPNFPECNANFDVPQSENWHEIFFGYGVTENTDNPGNPGNTPPISANGYTMDLQSSIEAACFIVGQCMLFAAEFSLVSIDLHVVRLVGDQIYWQCVGYSKTVGSGDYFTVQNSQVVVAYGYDFDVTAATTAAVQLLPSASSTEIATGISLRAGAFSTLAPIVTPAPLSSTQDSISPAPTNGPTTNGVCGNGINCLGWILGECCSSYGFCGNTTEYCDAGCQSAYGICSNASSSITTAASIFPPSIIPSSTFALLPSISPTPAFEPTNCGSIVYSGGEIPSYWGQIYTGVGFTENPDNPGNIDSDPITIAYPPDLIANLEASSCQTLDLCLQYAYTQGFWNVDFHLLRDSATIGHWVCTAYFMQAGGDFFNVANVDVVEAYGYDLLNGYTPPVSSSSINAAIPTADIFFSSLGATAVMAMTPTSIQVPALPTATTLVPTTDGTCGNGITCLGWVPGECCSQYGYCGSDTSFCGAGCQSEFGSCGLPSLPILPLPSSSSSPPSVAMSSAIPDIIPSKSLQFTLPMAMASSSAAPSTMPTPAGGLVPTDNGVCGNGVTCLGWYLGECCSEFGYCGSDGGFCGVGCQAEFGICGLPSSSLILLSPPSTSPALLTPSIVPSPSLEIMAPSSIQTSTLPIATGLILTDDGVCGNGVTCLGWVPGQCCSQYGYCGSDAGFCGAGCQPEFGICGLPSSSLPVPALPSSTLIIASPSPPLFPSSTIPISPPAPTCSTNPASISAYNCGLIFAETGADIGDWTQRWFGSSCVENSNNPGNFPFAPPATKVYPPGPIADQEAASCTTLNDCMAFALAQPDGYFGVDLHLLDDGGGMAHWECVAYYDGAGGNYFGTVNVNVLIAMGYDRGAA